MGEVTRSERLLTSCWAAAGLPAGSLQLRQALKAGSPGPTAIGCERTTPCVSTSVSSTMNVLPRRSHILRRSGKPQPWCSRRLSELVAVNVYCAAFTTCRALSVGKCGRFSCEVPPGTRSALPNAPKPGITSSVNIWMAIVLCPATIGVAPDVPPKLPYQLFDE